jgi:biotin synthase
LPSTKQLPKQIRVSLGTAIVLGLVKGKLDAAPTTAYLMTYTQGKCTGNCGFCPQARTSKSSTQMLSRVSWPTFPTETALEALTGAVDTKRIYRVCIQALNYPEVFHHLKALVKEIKNSSAVAVSVSSQPKNKKNIKHKTSWP